MSPTVTSCACRQAVSQPREEEKEDRKKERKKQTNIHKHKMSRHNTAQLEADQQTCALRTVWSAKRNLCVLLLVLFRRFGAWGRVYKMFPTLCSDIFEERKKRDRGKCHRVRMAHFIRFFSYYFERKKKWPDSVVENETVKTNGFYLNHVFTSWGRERERPERVAGAIFSSSSDVAFFFKKWKKTAQKEGNKTSSDDFIHRSGSSRL